MINNKTRLKNKMLTFYQNDGIIWLLGFILIKLGEPI